MKQEVKIFLGGGVTLLEGDKNEVGYRPSVVDPAISKLNSRRDADRFYIVKTFSDLTHEYAPEGQQEHYLRYLEKEADIALFIFDGTIGDKTKEEVEHACNSYNKQEHPTVYFYGTNLKDDDEIVKYLSSKNQYFQHFKDKEHLSNLIQTDLSSWGGSLRGDNDNPISIFRKYHIGLWIFLSIFTTQVFICMVLYFLLSHFSSEIQQCLNNNF